MKEIFGLADEEIVETLPFDIRFQYAIRPVLMNSL
ncbi:hypothetical protein [Muricomes intestini]